MTEYNLLEKISSPKDLKALDNEQIKALATEIRGFLVESVTKTGGHLASNLGVVELTLAIHRVFDSPKDHIIFDVGHQSYVHKLLTGRRGDFAELRTPGGLSGFTKRSESEHDCFGAGHSSTSLSAALGFAESDARNGVDAYTVVVLGDGAFTGGMIHEAINNCRKDLKLIIILNENEMSISRNKGGFASHMSKLRSSKSYFKVKDATAGILGKIPLVGRKTVNLIRNTKQTLKNALYRSNYFEHMGLYYMGPVDGNDYTSFVNMLELAKNYGQSTVIHTVTKKGKGYEPAEKMPQVYHMIPKGGAGEEKEGFSTAFGKALTELASKEKDVCGITAAMPHGTGLGHLKERYPDRFYDVGIAEEHAATFAAGLCANGMRPYFACYSSFLQRAYDNIVHDIALQNLPVTLCVDRAGLNEGDGATHHGIFDVSFLSAVPNLEIYTPCSNRSLVSAINDAYKRKKPCAIRYPRGAENAEINKLFCYEYGEFIRGDFDLSQKPEVIILTYGDIVAEAVKARDMLSEKQIVCGVILLEKLKPYDEAARGIADIVSSQCKKIVFLEEGMLNGGAASSLYEKLRHYESFNNIEYIIRAIDNDFVTGQKGMTLRESAGLTAQSIAEACCNTNNL